METQPETDLAVRALVEEHVTALEETIQARLASQGGVLAARVAAQVALEGLRGLKTDSGERRQRLQAILAQAKIDNIAAASPQPQPKTWFAGSGSRKPRAGETLQSPRSNIDRWNIELTALQCAATVFRSLQDRVVAIAEWLKNLQIELKDLIEAFAETADEDITTFLDPSHPELVAQLDQEWRTEIFAGQGEPSAPSERQESVRGNLLERLRQAGRTKVLDALRHGGFRELLPGGRGKSPLEPRLLKSCLESAAPRLGACGGSRRLWLIGACDPPSTSLRSMIELEAAEPPTVAIDPHSDFVIGWEIEGISLPRVAAQLIDNQREVAQLAALLHTRLDIDW